MNRTITNLPCEIWKEIPGYGGLYRVSNMGRLSRLVGSGWVLKKDTPTKTGYMHAGYTYALGKMKYLYTHRIVLTEFRGPPDDPRMTDVNHKNTIKSDNKIENLEWCKKKTNIIHAVFQRRFLTGLDNHWAKISDEDALAIFNSRENSRSLAKKHGVRVSHINRIKNKTRKKWIHIDRPISPVSLSASDIPTECLS